MLYYVTKYHVWPDIFYYIDALYLPLINYDDKNTCIVKLPLGFENTTLHEEEFLHVIKGLK